MIKGLLKWVGISIGIIWILIQALGIIFYGIIMHAMMLNA